MSKLDFILEELVTANRILANEGVVDSFGHVSARHPDNPQHYLLSRARAPERIERDDIVEYQLDGTPIDERGRAPYLERFIHGAVYEPRPDVHAVVHNHSPSVIPFGVTGKKLKPLLHMCASIGHEVPIWDSHDKFGDTTLLVTDMDMGRDLARALGPRPTALMRGHGATVVGRSVRHAVFVSVYLEVGAKLQMQSMAMGEIKFLTPGEVDKIVAASHRLHAQPRLGKLGAPRRAGDAEGSGRLGRAGGLEALRVLRNGAHEFGADVLTLAPDNPVGAIPRGPAVAVEEQHKFIEGLKSIELKANAFDRGVGDKDKARRDADPEFNGGEPTQPLTRIPPPFFKHRQLCLLKIRRTHGARLHIAIRTRRGAAEPVGQNT